MEATRASLVKSIGRKITTAFEFYVTLDLAVEDPRKLERAIRLLIKEQDAERTLTTILADLSRQFKLASEPPNLEQCIKILQEETAAK